jgi:hypothetical protein
MLGGVGDGSRVPQRMYLRSVTPIDTSLPAGTEAAAWEATVKKQTQSALESILDDLQACRASDPLRRLNPLAWRRATGPSPTGRLAELAD